MFHSLKSVALLAALPLALAQTYTDCNPLKKTCPADTGLTSTYTADFSTTGFSSWSSSSTSAITQTGNGAQFQITADGQAPTLTSDFYIFFGRVDVVMKAAPGVGIVSSIVLESDDLDEIDWEFLGGDTAQGQSNFFGKGDTSSYDRGAYHAVSNPQTTYHTYSIDWTSDRIEWLVDGAVVRTLAYSSALAKNGAEYPQTPARVKLGNWVAGGASNAAGTVEWAGGKTDFSQAPFSMYVKSISVTNYNPAASYTYGDMTGSYTSIQKGGAVSGSSGASSAVAVASSTSVVTSSSAASAQSSTSTTLVTSVTVVANKPVSIASSLTATGSSTTASVTSTVAIPVSSGFVSSSRVSASASATSSTPAKQTTNSAASVSISTGASLFGLLAAAFFF
ncbi:hypothetical protein AMS68_003708 [Peltaster fructicola]|uniref:Crh-like protein n=1 Tax=Peltaster fructicola TaxID=286661 RepID=A0A6H0XU46_9PEZI|nr:hypothetical protein AMS68_003708 [Peltaster fructicola]